MDDFEKVRVYWEKLGRANIDVEYKDHWLNDDGTPVDDAMYIEVANFVEKHVVDTNNEILEIGCGTGRILDSLIAKGFKNLTGIDFSTSQIDICKERELNCNLWSGDFLEFRREFSAKRFDLIFLHSVTQYFPSDDYFEMFLSAVFEALKPGGKILLIDVPIDWYKEEMISYTLKNKILKVIKNYLPSYIIEKLKLLRPVQHVKERIGNRYIEYVGFNGFYADPTKIYNICQVHNKRVEMIYQPFREKPVMYKKYRPIFILADADD